MTRRSFVDPKATWLSTAWFVYSLFCLICWPAGVYAQDDAYRKARLKMVEERVEREGVRNPVVLNAIRDVPRHLFVSSKFRAHAYEEVIIDIGHKQTLSTAYIVAYMTEAIDPRPTDRVLEIGTGSGYQAAVLSKIVKEVYTIEIVKPLGEEAAERLKELGYKNVKVKVGDGFKGWPEHAPFDKIIVTCSPENIPVPLAEQLKEGGKMIIPLGERYQQSFYLFEKKDGQLVKTKLLPTLFVPMTGIAEEQRKKRPDPGHPRLVNGGFEASTDGVADGWFYQRQATLEHQAAKEGKTYISFTNREPGRDSHVLQALGVDGKRVRTLRLSLWVKAEDVRPGPERYEYPALAVRFFDANNRQVGEQVVGGRTWLGTFPWSRNVGEIRVPREAHMMMIQLGLRGATGTLNIDDVRLTSR
jgi:protein-L-isoaspartate(D-aspartate) O-methyltransferase